MNKERKGTSLSYSLGFFGEGPGLVLGKRVAESPHEFFRHLGPEAPPFFQGLASAAVELEGRFSLTLIPGERYVPASVKRVVDVAEKIAQFTPEGECSLLPLGEKEPFMAGRQSIDGISLPFSHQGNGRVCQVDLSFSPSTRRTTFGENGQPFERFDGLRLEEVRRTLSFQGKRPEEIFQMIKTYEENLPSLRIVSGGAEFIATFLPGFVLCKLQVMRGIYDREEQSDFPQEDQNDSAGLKEVLTTTVYNLFPLSRFTRSGDSFSSQEAVDRWLNRIAVDIVKKAKVSKEIKGNKRR